MSEKQRRILRLAEVKQRTGRPTSSIYDSISKGEFPRPVPLGPKAVGWLESEIDLYIEQCVAERDNGTANAKRSLPLAGSKRRKIEASPQDVRSPQDVHNRREGRRAGRGGRRETARRADPVGA